jgi:mitochondrial fission protein ELM1
LSRGRTFVVQLQDPRAPARRFDLVAPPRHDKLEGDGVFPVIGSPHRVTEERLALARAAFAPQLSPLPTPRVAVLIGGRSKAFDLTEATAERLAGQLGDALDASSGSLMMTFSRRTPEAAKRLLSAALGGRPGLIWDGEGENPYFAFLAAADFIVVTQDSVNMVAEAAATGKPIYIARVDGDQWRKRNFHADLSRLGVARPFEGRLEPYVYEPLRETDRLAREVVRRLRARV